MKRAMRGLTGWVKPVVDPRSGLGITPGSSQWEAVAAEGEDSPTANRMKEMRKWGKQIAQKLSLEKRNMQVALCSFKY